MYRARTKTTSVSIKDCSNHNERRTNHKIPRRNISVSSYLPMAFMNYESQNVCCSMCFKALLRLTVSSSDVKGSLIHRNRHFGCDRKINYRSRIVQKHHNQTMILRVQHHLNLEHLSIE